MPVGAASQNEARFETAFSDYENKTTDKIPVINQKTLIDAQLMKTRFSNI
jgi:hypothetical protein